MYVPWPQALMSFFGDFDASQQNGEVEVIVFEGNGWP